MEHLAKVSQKKISGKVSLQLLARQVSESLWEPISAEKSIETPFSIPYNEGVLVLLKLDTQNQVIAVTDATDWVLDLVSQYLSQGITPEFLKQEMERAEQWRQSLTLQSQEVRRRALETAARRDEIQALEQRLRLEQEELERRESALTAAQQAMTEE
jgi:hypothetical protein